MSRVSLAALTSSRDLFHARLQMAVSLGWHIVIACFGIAFPAMVVFAEWRAHRRGDADLTGNLRGSPVL